MPKTDPRVDKRRVTMRNITAFIDEDGKVATAEQVATDYVRPGHLEAYVADARLRWAHVEVSEDPDAGPGGYDGQTHVPAHLDLPDAGTTYPANEG